MIFACHEGKYKECKVSSTVRHQQALTIADSVGGWGVFFKLLARTPKRRTYTWIDAYLTKGFCISLVNFGIKVQLNQKRRETTHQKGPDTPYYHAT